MIAACALDVIKPNLTSQSSDISCHLKSICTAVECCVDADIIADTFAAYVTFDPCDRMIQLGIDNYQFDMSMYDFSWGMFYYVRLSTILDVKWYGDVCLGLHPSVRHSFPHFSLTCFDILVLS